MRGTKKKPGDVRFAGDVGAHGWAAAGSNELWVDVTVVSLLGSSYLSAASAARGSAASAAAKHKHTKQAGQLRLCGVAKRSAGARNALPALLLAGQARRRLHLRRR